MSMNTAKGVVKACIVRSPGFADLKREAMEDIALLTGGYFISDEKGISLLKATEQHLGHAKKIVVSKEETIIIGGAGKKEAIEDLLNDLKMSLTQAEGEEKDKIENRIAKLTGGVAVLYVGAATETEMREKKDRCDDAVRATKSAIAEGYVPGGGRMFQVLSFRIESKLMAKVLLAPFRQICENAGVDYLKTWERFEGAEINTGYNAKTDTVENLVETGVIDPVKVLRLSLENAASTATMILTASCHIVDSM